MQVFARQIDTPQLAIFFHVADDVGELERNSRLFSELLRSGIAVTEDANTDQTDYRSHVVAVVVELIEGFVMDRRTALAAAFCFRQIHRGALHQLFQKIERNVKRLLRIDRKSTRLNSSH